MYTLRCTQKLLRRVRETIEPEPPAPTTMLGDWYANVVTVAGKPFVLAVSERTFLPLVVPLREARTLRRRVQEQAAEVLLRLRVPQVRFEHEVEQMSDAVFSRTPDRQSSCRGVLTRAEVLRGTANFAAERDQGC